jgi:hypothetical protein
MSTTTDTMYTFYLFIYHSQRQTDEGTSRLERTIDLGGVGEEVADTARVAPLVVVPRDELNKVLVERDTGLGVEDRRVVVAGKVGRDDLVLGVADNALVRRLGRLLDNLLDLIVRRGLLQADDEINDGDVDSGDTESKAPAEAQ